jgi:hypothetical protein
LRVSGKNTTARRPRNSECGLSERRTSGREVEVNTTYNGGRRNVLAGEEVVVEDTDYAKIKNKFIKPKKTAEERRPELSSVGELRT